MSLWSDIKAWWRAPRVLGFGLWALVPPPLPRSPVTAGRPRQVFDLGRARRKAEADRVGDCRKWTPLDALHELADEIERGDVALTGLVMIGFHRESEGAPWHLIERKAGVTRTETIALLAAHQQREIKGWVD